MWAHWTSNIHNGDFQNRDPIFSICGITPSQNSYTEFFSVGINISQQGENFCPKYGQNSSFCDFVAFCGLVHVQSIIYLFAKQRNNALKPALNHQTTGKITKICVISHKCPYIQARPHLYGRIGHTGQQRTQAGTTLLLHSFVQNGGKKWTLNKKRYPVP